MTRLLIRLTFWPLLLVTFVALLLPFTGSGTRWLLGQVRHFIPVEIKYADGTLAGELRLAQLNWSDEDIRLELQDVLLELDPRCLWRSAICLQQLQARQLDIEILPTTATQSMDAAPGLADDWLRFPFPLEVPYLQLAALRVSWTDGEWRQGVLDGSVELRGHTIHVIRAAARDARLILADTPSDDDRVELPEIDLPLVLQVDDLLLQQAGWDFYGEQGGLQTLRLQGNWQHTALQLDAVQLRSGEWGEAVAAGTLAFSGQWPLALGMDAFPPAAWQWPELLTRHLRLDASGDLAKLALQLKVGGEVSATARGQLDTLDSALPFQLAVDIDWSEQLDLASHLPLPEALEGLSLTSPLHFSANGSLSEQRFQLEAAGSAPGFSQLALNLAGEHRPGTLLLEDLRLQDAGSASTLWGSGKLDYAERVQWRLALESSGLELAPLGDSFSGRLQGQLQLDGWLEGEDWEVAVSGVDLSGQVNKLPATISGYAGLAGDLALLPSNLQADINGARLLLRASQASAGGSLELEVQELGRWLSGARGRIDLRAELEAGWGDIGLAGTFQALRWEGVAIDRGQVSGDYHVDTGTFAFQLGLDTVELADFELERLALEGTGDGTSQTFVLRAGGDANGELSVAGRVDASGDWRGELAATAVQTPQGTWHLDEPVPLLLERAEPRLLVTAHCWHYRESRICPGQTVLAETGQTSVEIGGDLDVLSLFLPEYLETSGDLSARLAASWAPDTPGDVQGELHAADIVVTRLFGAGESASGHWDSLQAKIGRGEQGLELEASLVKGGQRLIALALQLPALRDGALAGTLVLDGPQLANLQPFFPDLDTLEGELRGELALGGTLAAPETRGVLYLHGGRLALLGNPTELAQLELALNASGDRLSVQGQGLLGGGELNISGELTSRPAWRLDLAVAGGRHEVLIPPYTQMQVSEQLQLIVTGAELAVKGQVTVHEGKLEQERLPEGSVDLSRDVVEVDYQGRVVDGSSRLLTQIDIALSLEDRFRVVGDMVNATLGGDLQLLQKPGKPLQLFGNLNVIGGELRAYQQRLRIQRGTVSFSGPTDNPELDVSAQRDIPSENVVVGLRLQGSLQQPVLQIFSDPVMPQADAMSYLIRGRPVDTGAAVDGVATALSLGTGLVNETPLISRLNEIPGISNVGFGAEGTTEEDTAATVGGYIGERLYLSYGMGIYEPINVLIARLYLQTRLWLEVVSRLENSVDLYYSFDID